MVVDTSVPARYLLWELGYDAVEKYLLDGTHPVDRVVKEVIDAIWKHTVIWKGISLESVREPYTSSRE